MIIEPGYIAPGMKHDDDHPGPAALRRAARPVERHGGHTDGPRGPAGPRAGGDWRWPTPWRTRRRRCGWRSGQDAAMVLQLRRTLSDAEFEATMREALGLTLVNTMEEVTMEKLMYLTWLEADQHPGRGGRGHAWAGWASELLALEPRAPDHGRLGSRERHPGARAHPRGRDAAARARLALGRQRSSSASRSKRCWRRPPSRVAGYSVVESLYRDYGGNQWAEPALVARRGAVARRAHRGALAAAPRAELRGVDDALAHPDLADHRGDPAPHPLRPQRRVPAASPKGRHRWRASWRRRGPPWSTSPIRCCSTARTATPSAMNAHVTQMIEEINAFVDLSTLRSVTMSEWILKS